MNIRFEDWVRYRDKLSKISEKAADAVRDYVWKEHSGLNDVSAEEIISYTKAVVDRYSDASSALACQMYDEIAKAQKAFVPPAEPAEAADYGEVAKAIRGVQKQSPEGKLIGDPAYRFVKRAAADTMLNNAKRDGAEFAWIPSGDGCAFCQMVASRGWQLASNKTVQGNHADHIHANCKCQFAIRFDGRSTVEGYDPDKLRKQYDDAEGSTWQEKLNSMRRGQYAEKKDLQKSLNRARTFKSADDLRKVSKSPVLDMTTVDEFRNHFQQYGVSVEGFDKQNVEQIKMSLSGIDDAISALKGAENKIKKIEYNPNLKVYGKMSSDGIMQIGKVGLKDYGTGAHEVAHAFDFYKSGGDRTSYSEELVEKARKNLKLRRNSKEYMQQLIQITGSAGDAEKPYEVFAFGIETHMSGIKNDLSKEIFRLATEETV